MASTARSTNTKRQTKPKAPKPTVTIEETRELVSPEATTEREDKVRRIRELLSETGYNPDEVLRLDGVDTQPVEESSEPPAQVETTDVNTAVVRFYGREIEVRAPDLDEVAVLQLVQRQCNQATAKQEITAERAVHLIGRVLKAVGVVCVRPEDADFVQDLILDRETDITIMDTLPLIHAAMEALRKANPRPDPRGATRRSVGRSGRAELDVTV